MNIAVIGAGATGLAAGYELIKRGHSVTVYEKPEGQLGGLAGNQTLAGAEIDKFYHHIFTSDTEIISLIGEAGMSHKLVWKDAKNGILAGGLIHPFTSPADLLRYRGLSLPGRVRTGLAVLRAKGNRDFCGLEDISARDWLVKNAGRESYEKLWRPLLDSKFGEDADSVGGVWIWNKFKLRGSTRRNVNAESLGYLQGGFGALYTRLSELIADGGGRIVRAGARSISRGGGGLALAHDSGREQYDSALFTGSPHELCSIADLPPEYAERARSVRYKANVCLTLVTERQLSDYYWVTVAEPGAPFVLFIEHSNLFPDPAFGGRGFIFLSRYLDAADPLYGASERDIADTFFSYLGAMFPHFSRDGIVEYKVRRARWAQPVVGLRHREKLLPFETPLDGLYIASMPQIYPEDRGQNYAVALGRRAAARIGG
ncbi:MAG: NAD(P)/FAD-dependent oxidoreductase [Oscillospiraceae bacterium]|jgi:protoporphyrinogen oxidase|nr:NAD(P)/FAD-dependent oxidoreductase [Oscillospiraceae bacterium]